MTNSGARPPSWFGARVADMPIGRKLVAIVLVCVGLGFVVMIGVQITGTRADLHNLAFHNAMDISGLLTTSVVGGVRSRRSDAVERSYEIFLNHDDSEVSAVVALDINGQILAEFNSGLLPDVDLHREIQAAQEFTSHNQLFADRASDHIVIVSPILDGPNSIRVGTLAIAWDLADINALIKANLDRQGILAGLTLVALIVMLLAVLSYTVTHPLRAVSQATMRLAQGESSVDVPESVRGDEIGEMARALEVFKRHIAMIDEMTEGQEEHARQLSEALENERKYNALHREFVAMASHEFRTPLAIIDGAAQRMVRRAQKMPPEEIVERVGKVRSAVGRMVGLIDSTLSASRMEAGRVELSVEPCSLHEVLTAVCDRQQEISQGHDIQLGLGDAPDLIVADPKQLDQIFTNLLSNAVKYSPQKGLVEVTACKVDTMAVISVRDHGVGIPKDELPKLFGRFFRASTSTGIPGTGIGLNLVKELVAMHGGSIGVESIEQGGSTFTVNLPLQPTTKTTGTAHSAIGAEANDASLRAAVGT